MTWKNAPSINGPVVTAFRAGKAKRNGDLETDGKVYTVHGYHIVKHVEKSIPDQVAEKLLTGSVTPLYAFRYPKHDKILTNHLRLFSVRAPYWGRGLVMEAKLVDPDTWYTLEELAQLPQYNEPPWSLKMAPVVTQQLSV